jgi:hypothetical protein
LAKLNGSLRQLAPRTRDATPWIGWGLLAVVLTALGFFATLWIKSLEVTDTNLRLKIAEVERETNSIKLAMQTEKIRLDTLQAAVVTLTSTLDRIDQNFRSIDNRLTRMEISSENQRLKNKM